MRLLLIHQNLPGQYKHLLNHYARRPDVEVVGLGEARRLKENFRNQMPGLKLVGYEMTSLPAAPPSTLRTTEAAVHRGRAVLGALLRLKKSGFHPDVVYAHPGWGETLFLKDVYPHCKLIHFCEFYYQSTGQDFNFDPEFPSSVDDVLGLRARNFHHLMALEQADVGIAPTFWQRDRFPICYQSKIEVVHDGIDTSAIAPDPEAFVYFPNKNLRLTRADEVITYVSRNLEPYRGFHSFMRALPRIMSERPGAHVIVVGGDEVSYGQRAPNGTYRTMYLAEIAGMCDMSRVHFVGKLPYSTYLKVLQISTAHIYLTYPFVLSWSMLEAMSIGCLIIGSRTGPVEEVINHDENGLLVDFFSTSDLVAAVHEACENAEMSSRLRAAARESVLSRYDLREVCLPAQRRIIEGRTST